MQEKQYITAAQMGMMIFPVMVATADLLVPATTARQAQQDMWMSPMIASLVGFLTVYLVFQLHKLFPDESIIQFSGKIVGTFLGKLCGLLILFDFLYCNGNIIRQYGEFIVGSFLLETPLLVVVSSIVFLCAITVRAGVEVLARTAQVFVPIVVVLYAALLLLMIPSMKIDNLFPMLEHGVIPVLRGAYTPQGWFSEVILFSFVLPFRASEEKGMRTGMVTVGMGMLALTSINLSTLLVLGEEVPYMTYPFYSAIQMISYADFFENIDSIVIATWVTGAFIKISIFYFALALGTAQWLRLEDYRPIVLPLGLLLVVFSFWVAPNLSQLATNIKTIIGIQTTGYFTLIPLVLWIIAHLRKKKRIDPPNTMTSPPANE
ncbi:endospore germination permease [Brevibacillus centrosporus]|uniref:GerAB/ArcD/ProY family transporter n=1 Tax=Brevibacillus centrosporus TaxID=54910 RepID=UPI002E22A7D4|nr:endospore germination permease [Brevibacillus centrosporus]MED1949477.1 endospore germination permease [Brevibacillus centrosporus]